MRTFRPTNQPEVLICYEFSGPYDDPEVNIHEVLINDAAISPDLHELILVEFGPSWERQILTDLINLRRDYHDR